MKRLYPAAMATASCLTGALLLYSAPADAQVLYAPASAAHPYQIEEIGGFTVITVTGSVDDLQGSGASSPFTARVSYDPLDFSSTSSRDGSRTFFQLNAVDLELSFNGTQWSWDPDITGSSGDTSTLSGTSISYLIDADGTHSFVMDLRFDGIFTNLTHSDKFKPQGINAASRMVIGSSGPGPVHNGPGTLPDAAALLAAHDPASPAEPGSDPAESFAFGFENFGISSVSAGPGDGGLPAFGTSAPIPEPATWAMMLAGFGLAGLRLNTRRRAAG